jgi:RNA polymerase sigma-70 factor (ECF subfamily)
MMSQRDLTLDDLMRHAAEGDRVACGRLLESYRSRLRRMVELHMDRRLAARLDGSDVVQEALIDAVQKLPSYLQNRPVALYPWLRKLAWERLIQLHRRHLYAHKRSVAREERWIPSLRDDSALELAERLFARGSSPSSRLRREEVRVRVLTALARLSGSDREVLVLRHLEQLTPREIAAVLDVSEAVVYTRHLRALERIREFLGDAAQEEMS